MVKYHQYTELLTLPLMEVVPNSLMHLDHQILDMIHLLRPNSIMWAQNVRVVDWTGFRKRVEPVSIEINIEFSMCHSSEY